jgi:hypothetical protein
MMWPPVEPCKQWDQLSQYALTPGYFNGTPATPSILSITAPGHVPDDDRTDQIAPQPDKPLLVQLPDWEEERPYDEQPYDEQPSSHIHYSIGWTVALNDRVMAKDKQDMGLAISFHPQLFPKPKLEKLLSKKFSRNRRVRSDDPTIVIFIKGRPQRDLTRPFENTDIDWLTVEKQFLMEGPLFSVGKELGLAIFVQVYGGQPLLSRGFRGSTDASVLKDFIQQLP